MNEECQKVAIYRLFVTSDHKRWTYYDQQFSNRDMALTVALNQGLAGILEEWEATLMDDQHGGFDVSEDKCINYGMFNFIPSTLNQPINWRFEQNGEFFECPGFIFNKYRDENNDDILTVYELNDLVSDDGESMVM